MSKEQKKKVQKIAESFRNALGFSQVLSKSGSELLFENDNFTALFRERFGITSDNKDVFNAAFRAVTEGNGKEITKINSVISSALLPLLVFYKLYVPQKEHMVRIKFEEETIDFSRVFFEVRNNVIGSPSCVDVALISKDGKTILFLESKLTEMFESSTEEAEYGKSYKPLYHGTAIEDALKNSGITIDPDATNLILRSIKDEPQYLEGIKQTISHLIGLVRGPQDAEDQTDYKEVYKRAKRLLYSPILYDTTKLLDEQRDEYSKFTSLYENVIGRNRDSILKAIKEWNKNNSEFNKTIEIHSKAITYQNLIEENPNWLDEKVKTFYCL